MRPPRSNAWRPPLVAMNCLDPPAAASAESRTDRTDTSHAPASAYPPPFPPLHPQLANSPHELLAHLLETGLLHWREIARHLAIFILLDLDHLGPPGPHPVHQLAHAVGVGGDARLHLTFERATPRHLLLHQGAPAGAELLLRGAQLRRRIGRQLEGLLHALAEALLDLRAQPARLGGVALRA